MPDWTAEENWPEAWAVITFSPIVVESGEYIVYVGGVTITKFYKYNLDTNTWTELTDPPAALYAQLSMSPDETKLAGHVANGTQLFIYTISGNSWASSSVAPQMNGNNIMIQSTVWADDNDTVWCQVRASVGATLTVKFFKYVVSIDTWTQYTNSVTPATHNSICLCINTAGTILYAGQCGATYRATTKYTIATDTYGSGPTLPSAYYFTLSADQHKLWYGPKRTSPAAHVTITNFVNPDTEGFEGVFPELDAANKPSNLSTGVYGVVVAIADYKISEPKNWSYIITPATPIPTVTTDPATAIR